MDQIICLLLYTWNPHLCSPEVLLEAQSIGIAPIWSHRLRSLLSALCSLIFLVLAFTFTRSVFPLSRPHQVPDSAGSPSKHPFSPILTMTANANSFSSANSFSTRT